MTVNTTSKKSESVYHERNLQFVVAKDHNICNITAAGPEASFIGDKAIIKPGVNIH